MPLMQKIGPAKGYKLPALKKGASPEEEAEHAALAAAWEAVKAGGVKEVPAIGANEALQYGKGMYEIVQETAAAVTPVTAVVMPEDMSADALKLTALQLGVDVKSGMKRSELVAAVRRAMDAVQLLDDEDEDGA